MNSQGDHSLTVYLLLDASASMYGAALQAAHDAFERITYTLPRILPPDYSCKYNVLLYHSTLTEVQCHESAFLSNIASTWRAGGTSNLGKAWSRMTDQHRETHGSGLCIVFTDGHPTDDFSSAGRMLPRTRIHMIGIGCGIGADLTLLQPYFDAAFLWHDMNADAVFRFFSETCSRLIAD